MKEEQSQSSQIIVMNAVPAMSPDSMVNENEEIQLLPSNSAWKCYWKRCMFLAMLVLCSAMLGYEINAQGQDVIRDDDPEKVYNTTDLSFTMFCPISAQEYLVQKPFPTNNNEDEDLRRRLYSYESYPRQNIYLDPTQEKKNYDPTRTYQIEARSIQYNHTVMNGSGFWKNVTSPRLFYCGLMSDFLDNCTKTYYACSSPGALFDIQTRENVDILWINNLNSQLVPNDDESSNFGDSCLKKNYVPRDGNTEYCNLMAKTDKQSAVTFPNPTNGIKLDSPAMHHTKISPKNWPMNVHVHGAEVRPTFDGNPLSWIGNGNASTSLYGIGAYSLNNKCYYDSFDRIENIDQKGRRTYLPPPELLSIDPDQALSNKTNRYPNRQNPGNLWYHDHSMRLTNFNVRNGLAGVYLLRDPEVEKVINVPRENQKFVLVSATDLKTSFNLKGFRANVTYRFRFLNSVAKDFGETMRFSFSYDNCSANGTREFFSIIGADSSLFHESIDHQQSFVLHNAERIELLIRFDNPDETSFSICAEQNIQELIHNRTDFQQHSGHSKRLLTDATSYSIKGIKIDQTKQKKDSYRDTIDNIKLNVPYTDLSVLQDSQIAVSRFRPLMFLGQVTFTINGRIDFHNGWSQNPTMGTVEDWYLINTIWFGHPIHVHLINFQVIREYDLLKIDSNSNDKSQICSIYELDFLLHGLLEVKNSNNKTVQEFQKNSFYTSIDGRRGVNYTFLCLIRVQLGRNKQVREALSRIYPQNQTDSERKSGLDLFTIATDQDKIDLANAGINTTDWDNVSKYILNKDGHPSQYPYYSRWKDTAWALPFKALKYRIRWTKSNFTQQDRKAGNFFHIPSDQLREFPGYVYHCHILSHEDNEMMRPIMLQMPHDGKLNPNTTCNSDPQAYDWNQKYKCINDYCKKPNSHY